MHKLVPILTGAVFAAGLGSEVHAHSMWISVIQSLEDGHFLSSIGLGHTLPMDESLAPDWGTIRISRYELVSPSGNRSPLGLPDPHSLTKTQTSPGISIQTVDDIGLRKLTPEKSAEKGTYQVVGQMAASQTVHYRDRSGREHYVTDTPIASISDLGAVLESSYGMLFMKSVFAVGEWTAPQPVGDIIEIVPLSDLSKVRVGDKAKFKTFFNGKPLQWREDFSSYLTASNQSLGPDWCIHINLSNGVGEMTVTAPGQWRIDGNARRPVREIAALSGLADQDSNIRLSATLTFTASP